LSTYLIWIIELLHAGIDLTIAVCRRCREKEKVSMLGQIWFM